MTVYNRRIAIIGLGAMGTQVLTRLRHDFPLAAEFAALVREQRVNEVNHVHDVTAFSTTEAVVDWRPDLVVECAGHDAVTTIVPDVLARGVDCVVASIGATAGTGVVERLQAAAEAGGARLIYASGAIGGLDALRCAQQAGIDSVIYTGRKPPRAWRGSPAEDDIDLDAITTATAFFEGNVAAAALRYPKNTNVTAAVALAGIGFVKTRVRLIADPAIEQNRHEVEVTGDFGAFEFRIRNNPLPGNPRTSMLAALSIEASVVEYFRAVGF